MGLLFFVFPSLIIKQPPLCYPLLKRLALATLGVTLCVCIYNSSEDKVLLTPHSAAVEREIRACILANLDLRSVRLRLFIWWSDGR